MMEREGAILATCGMQPKGEGLGIYNRLYFGGLSNNHNFTIYL